MKCLLSFWVLVGILLCVVPSFAKPVCVDVTGEGVLRGGDLSSARTEALNRAKLAAVEQVAGVELKSRTVVSDAALLEEIINTQARGIVTGVQLIGENRQGDLLSVRIKACVEPSQAKDAISPLALNSTVAVFISVGRLDGTGADDVSVLSEMLNNALIQRGFTVRDLADERNPLKHADLEQAIHLNRFLALRSLVYRFKSNTILIGKVEPTLSAVKGDEVGHGIRMPFNKVTARLIYRLLTRDAKGKLVMLAAGSDEAIGLAATPEDARQNALKNLAEQIVPVLVAKVDQRMAELANKITVLVEGVTTPQETFAVRDLVRQITWVGAIEEVGVGRLRVTFPENPLYLANGLTQKGFRIISYSPGMIQVRQR